MKTPVVYLLALVLMGAGWGLTQPLSKIAVSNGHGHFGLIFWQMVIGTLAMGAVLVPRGRLPQVTGGRLAFAALIAVIGTILPNSAAYIAYVHLPAGIMSILIATVPLLAFPLAVAMGTDRLGALRLAGLALGFLGVVLIASPGGGIPAGAAVWIAVGMIGPLFYAIESNVVGKWGMGGMDGVQLMFLASLIGAGVTLPLALGSGQMIDPTAGLGRPEAALIASSLIHVFAYAAYVWLASVAGAVFATQSSYVVTGTGVLWAMALLGERFPPLVWLALVLMMAGVALVQPRGRKGAPEGV